MNNRIGDTVGYSVRFDEKYSNQTRIKYMTDGMLLREAMIDKELSKYSIIILDEAHERSLNSDTLLALVKQISRTRGVKLIIMSATLSVDRFSEYLGTKNVLSIKGRSFPIEVYNVLEIQNNFIVSI
jgi:HrpA-like RNA helicase